jgi:hypothetical protein
VRTRAASQLESLMPPARIQIRSRGRSQQKRIADPHRRDARAYVVGVSKEWIMVRKTNTHQSVEYGPRGAAPIDASAARK